MSSGRTQAHCAQVFKAVHHKLVLWVCGHRCWCSTSRVWSAALLECQGLYIQALVRARAVLANLPRQSLHTSRREPLDSGTLLWMRADAPPRLLRADGGKPKYGLPERERSNLSITNMYYYSRTLQEDFGEARLSLRPAGGTTSRANSLVCAMPAGVLLKASFLSAPESRAKALTSWLSAHQRLHRGNGLGHGFGFSRGLGANPFSHTQE